jgi:hypothetical protein
MSPTYVLAGLTVIVAGVYTLLEFNNPELLEKLTMFVTTSFATSQAIWIIVQKLADKNDTFKSLMG